MCKPVPVGQKVSHPPEPKLRALVSYLMRVLATEFWSSARAGVLLNMEPSLAPLAAFKTK